MNFYKKIVKIRLKSKYKTIIRDGIYKQELIDDENIYMYLRTCNNCDDYNTIIVICNLTSKIVSINIDEVLNQKLENTKIVLSNYNRKVMPKELKEYEGVVLAVRL